MMYRPQLGHIVLAKSMKSKLIDSSPATLMKHKCLKGLLAN